MVSADLKTNLEALVRGELGAEFELADVQESDGHAGLTFLFDTRRRDTHAPAGSYVLKVPPPGVARRGNTDVYRQAPLMRALQRNGLPVPKVPFASEDERYFGVPYIVMEKLPGRTYFVWDPHPSFARTAQAGAPLWCQAVQALPAFHRFDWQRELANWQTPEPLPEQVSRWRRIYQQAPEPQWSAAAEVVEALLLKTMPTATPVGLYHGDYQPGNILYEKGQLTGIIDWEISGIGDVLLDIGWLMMVADPANWIDSWHAQFAPSQAEIRDIYEHGMDRTFAEIPWYQAFAGFRLGSIGCLNVKLHRKGQRHDPIWESMGLCLSNMFERARQILLA